jgi:hypothetical protein
MELRLRLELSIGGGSAIEMTTGQPKFLMSVLSLAIPQQHCSQMSALWTCSGLVDTHKNASAGDYPELSFRDAKYPSTAATNKSAGTSPIR